VSHRLESQSLTEIHNLALVARDGVALAADAYLPAGEGPWPTVVTYLPYVKDAWVGVHIDGYLRYFAKYGYASVIVDFRGTGASGGGKPEAFEARESEDVYDIVEALAAEPWCDGRVGMWGQSYGGITALRAAAAAPPHLCAIVAIEGSTDPYLYEVMRYGVPGLAMIYGEWSSWMLALNALPPVAGVPTGVDPDAVWREHLEALRPWHFDWPQHPRYDDYWNGRSVDAHRITVPTLFITSWRDGTLAGPWNDFAQVAGPRRMIAGPWQHGIPDEAPAHPINSSAEMLRWWEQWLGGVDPDGDCQATVSVFVQGADRWEAHDSWPPETVIARMYPTALDGALSRAAPTDSIRVPVAFDATVGSNGGLGTQHRPIEQSPDDERSLCFDSPPLERPLDIAGTVCVMLSIPDHDVGSDVAVRLEDVASDGSSALITKGYRRLSNPPPYRPEASAIVNDPVAIELNPTRFRVREGHRVRLAVAAADFPEIWPTAATSGFTVELGPQTWLSIPVLDGSVALPEPVFEPLDASVITEATRSVSDGYSVVRDGSHVSIQGIAGAQYLTPRGDHVSQAHTYGLSTEAGDPGSTVLKTDSLIEVIRPSRRLRAEASTLSSPRVHRATVRVLVDDQLVYERAFGPTDEEAH
jgi:uncharacterized protein